MSAPPSPESIVIIGAGIIGLTTAIRVLKSPLAARHSVHIIADHLPGDPLDAAYASTAAGAHHVSFAENGGQGAKQRDWDLRTLAAFQEEYKQVGETTGLMAITENFTGSKKHLDIMEAYPDFKLRDPPTGVNYAASYSTYTMTPSIYLAHLVDEFKRLASPDNLHVARISSLDDPEITRLAGRQAGIIVCAGLHSTSLCHDDEEVYPIRGQVVKVLAPWVTEGSTRQVGALGGRNAGLRTYLIPNLGGVLVVGGTRGDRDWEKHPRSETTTDILDRAVEAFPWLTPPDGASLQSLIISEVVGFRPSRDAGIRLERGPDVDGTNVVYNYGHGGAGWQSSWATAEDAVTLLEQSFV